MHHDKQNNMHRDKLHQLFAEVTNQESGNAERAETDGFIEIDVLQLPPRSEVHQKAKLRIHFNMRSPFWQFSFFVVLLVAILFVLYYFVGNNLDLFFK